MKNGDKILQLNKLWFKLSDNFDGTLPDAIRELAQFLEDPSPPLPALRHPNPDDVWAEFLEVENNGGRM
jgi:hypothetical protein